MDTTDDWSETSLAACATGDDAPVDTMDVDVCPGPVPVLSTFAWSPGAMFYSGNRDDEDDYLDAPLEHLQEHDYPSEETLTEDALGSPLGLDNGTASPYAVSEADSPDLDSEVSLGSPLDSDEAVSSPHPESEPEDSEDEGDDEDDEDEDSESDDMVEDDESFADTTSISDQSTLVDSTTDLHADKYVDMDTSDDFNVLPLAPVSNTAFMKKWKALYLKPLKVVAKSVEDKLRKIGIRPYDLKARLARRSKIGGV